MINEVLEPVCKHLEANNIDYMLTGGIAFSCYAIPRFSRDIDIVIHLKQNHLNPFFKFLSKNFLINKDSIMIEFKKRGMFNVFNKKYNAKIDFILTKMDEFEAEAFERRRYIKVFDGMGWVISPEDLVISKLRWIQDIQSPLHISDIGQLWELNNIDREYVKAWIKKLKLKTFNLLK